MYKIFADNTLIYDSTLDDYKIGKGSVTLEVNKSGSFTFSIYPDHFYYESFVKLKTVITVYKSGKIIFRGRILNDVTDYWNNKVITCEGELGFLQDSIIRPFDFVGTPEELFIKFIEEHNAQVDEFKQFKIGEVTVVDPNDYIIRENSAYESSLTNLNSRLISTSLAGYIYITHGENGEDPIPTINYVADFTKISPQKIEFGYNLKNYTKTVKANDIATAIIPLGSEMDDGDDSTENQKLTIASVNDGKDYVYSEEGVALYGWIFKTVTFDDVTDASNLKSKGEQLLTDNIKQLVTIELTAVDIHLIDPDIESINICEYVRALSEPHNFDATMLCTKQTIDILKPDNDSYTLGHTYASLTTSTAEIQKNMGAIDSRYVTTQKLVAHTSSVIEHTEERIVSIINESADIITLKGNRMSLESDNFTLAEDGTINAKKGNLDGLDVKNCIIRETCEIKGKLTANDFCSHNGENIYGKIYYIDESTINREQGSYVIELGNSQTNEVFANLKLSVFIDNGQIRLDANQGYLSGDWRLNGVQIATKDDISALEKRIAALE